MGDAFQMDGKSKVEIETEKMLEKQQSREGSAKEKKEKEATGFVFKKRGKISKEESKELRRTHSDILTWARSTKRESYKEKFCEKIIGD